MHRWVIGLSNLSVSRSYWLVIGAVCFILEAVALYYQHVLYEPPCLLCIHIRLCLFVAFLFAVLGFSGYRQPWLNGLAHLGAMVSLWVMLQRSWITLLVERQQYESQCGMSLGLPDFLPLDQWLPWMFEVQSSCSYTPMLPLGITMAEALVVISIGLTSVATLAVVGCVINVMRRS